MDFSLDELPTFFYYYRTLKCFSQLTVDGASDSLLKDSRQPDNLDFVSDSLGHESDHARGIERFFSLFLHRPSLRFHNNVNSRRRRNVSFRDSLGAPQRRIC